MTIRRCALSVLYGVLAMIACHKSASAQYRDWKAVGHWHIGVTTDAKSAFCRAAAGYNAGTDVYLTVNPETRVIGLTLEHERWKSIEEGQEYPVEFYWDGLRGTGKMFGTKVGNTRGIVGGLTQTGLSRFMNANTMKVVYKGETVAKLDLSGTTAAVTELQNCQLAVNPGGWPSADNPPDPFRR